MTLKEFLHIVQKSKANFFKGSGIKFHFYKQVLTYMPQISLSAQNTSIIQQCNQEFLINCIVIL